ncbi:hypothetical protein C8N24_0138 [Solirubrobacter pauli]|uniref:Uncharacterized protein n=1 Tax=Solirubrobacter pauli TaxID=166793 RepID=A0A660L5T0_9ACTN|nr:hypothetical protein [Solirubrobacter pauli]RKQ90337.1 hypothetical protein C8N24_0138 [Solirubrobacter pauli]
MTRPAGTRVAAGGDGAWHGGQEPPGGDARGGVVRAGRTPGTVTVALLRAAPRAAVLAPVGGAAAAVVALTQVDEQAARMALQASTIALAAAAVALLDEPPLPGVPVGKAQRRVRLLAAGLPALGAAWLGLLALVPGEDGARLSLHFAAVLALALGAESVVPVALAFCAARVGAPELADAWWTAAACGGLLALAARSRD